MNRGGYRPRAVWIDSQWIGGTEFLAESLDRGDLFIGIEYAALPLDLFEAVLIDHLPALPDNRLWIQTLAVLVFANVVTQPAAARMFIEEISGERNLVPRASPHHIANRL